MENTETPSTMFRFLFGIFLGFLLCPLLALAWIFYGKVPVAVADPPFPQESLVTSIPLNARIQHEIIGTPPIQPDEHTLVAGARVYADRCAVCHGLNGKPSAFGTDMFPDAPGLLEKHRTGNVVGVSDDPPGETYWKVANGIRLTGMPQFKTQLSETEMWQVSLLLANADKPIPPAALDILRRAPAPPAEGNFPGSAPGKLTPHAPPPDIVGTPAK